MEMLQVATDTHDDKAFFSKLKTVYGPLLDTKHHSTIRDTALVTEKWVQQFKHLLNCQSIISEDAIAESLQYQMIEGMDAIPSSSGHLATNW